MVAPEAPEDSELGTSPELFFGVMSFALAFELLIVGVVGFAA